MFEKGNQIILKFHRLKYQVTGFIKSYLYNYIDNVAAISKAGADQSAFDTMYAGYQKVHLK